MATSSSGFLSAPHLYAHSQERACSGKERCYWCGAPCGTANVHGEVPPQIMRGYRSSAKVPSSHWICTGCWLWRRQSITLQFLNGRGYQDRQAPSKWSWLITEKEALALRVSGQAVFASGCLQDRELAYQYLLRPNGQSFCLSLVSSGQVNQLHLACVNQSSSGFTAGAQFTYTLDGRQLTYTVHELEEAIRKNANGASPGVRLLMEHLGPAPEGLVELNRDAPLKPKAGHPIVEQGQALRKKI